MFGTSTSGVPGEGVSTRVNRHVTLTRYGPSVVLLVTSMMGHGRGPKDTVSVVGSARHECSSAAACLLL